MKMKNLWLIDKMGFHFGLQILFSIIATINCVRDNLIISPSTAEVVHFVNETHIVTCSGDKGANIRWRNPKGDIVTTTKGRLHIETSTTNEIDNVALVFKTITLGDKGNWSCFIDGTDAIRSFRMIVNEPISFMDTPNFQNATENKDATIRCEVRGDPEPSITWYYNGEQIQLPNERYTKLADGLLIKKVTRNDSGEYMCRAYQISATLSNLDSKTIRLNIHHKPVGPHKKSKIEQTFGYKNGYVNLTCIAQAEPMASFTWYKGNKMLNGRSHKIFYGEHVSLLQVYVNDSKVFGDYKCLAANQLGSLEHQIQLKEGTKPDSPAKFDIKGFNSDSLSVDVGARKNKIQGAMDITAYRFELIPVEEFNKTQNWDTARQVDYPTAEGITYLITNLSHGTRYMVRVASINPAGLSDWTAVQEFQTFPIKPPSSKSVRSTSSTIFPLIIAIRWYLQH